MSYETVVSAFWAPLRCVSSLVWRWHNRVMRPIVRRGWCAVIALGALMTLASLRAEIGFDPATFKVGPPPVLQFLALGGGEVRLELTIDAVGRVSNVKSLRSTAGFTQPLTDAVRSWQFKPATDAVSQGGDADGRGPIASKVLVIGMFRPPTLWTPTLGEPVKDVGLPSGDAPQVVSTVMPGVPPMTWAGSANRSAAVVLAEITIDPAGRMKTRVVIPAGPDQNAAALAAIQAWQLVPARVGGRTVASRVYAVFGFSPPVV